MVETSVGVAVIAALVAASAFFSSSEIAVFSLEPHRLEALRAEDEGRYATLQRLVADPHRLLVTILVGNNLVNIAIASVATTLLVTRFDATTAAVVSTVVVSSVVLVFGEIVPKSYGVANAESWALRVARPVSVLGTALYPLVVAFEAVTGVINRVVGGESEIERPYVTREELTALVRTAERLGVIRDAEQEIMQRAFRFSDVVVGDLMVPRADVIAFDVETPVDEALRVCADERVTRVPVYRETLDDVVGYVDVRDLVRASERGQSLEDVLLPVLHAFEHRKADAVLAELQDERIEMAVVFDEFGQVEGLLTVEDIVEVVFGEIYDVGEQQPVTLVDATTASARGLAQLGAVAEVLDVPAPGDPEESVAGLLADRLGRPPEGGDVVEVDGLRVTVRAVEDNRVRRVLVERLPTGPGGPDEPSETADDGRRP